jgi:hypothetical protein
MGKSSQEKIDYAITLLKLGKTFRNIQKQLKNKFGSSMSFSTLTKLKDISAKNTEESVKIKQLEQELALFKRLYFELLDKDQEGGSTE